MKRARLAAWTMCAALIFAGSPLAQVYDSVEDDIFWDSVSGCTDAREVQLYLDQFPKGRHPNKARACLETLAKKASSKEIERLLKVCEMHFAAGRLTTGAGGTAVECYRRVLSLDPANRQAEEGLQRVFGKYVAWVREAVAKGNAGKARRHLEKLKGLDPGAPEVGELEEEIARLRQRPGHKFQDCPVCPWMVVVPAGSFVMGSPSHEHERHRSEGPVRRVMIAEPFAVGKYEVTFDEWDACVAAGGCNGYRPGDAGWGRGRNPVFKVSWHDAQTYVRWLSKKTGKPYRLPSEAEWEYVARAGTKGPFSFGAKISMDEANFRWSAGGNSKYVSDSKGVYPRRTVPVGSFPANKFGLHDLHGNVCEWVEDCWHDSHDGAPSDGSARSGKDCVLRVRRGGFWHDSAADLRSAKRRYSQADSAQFYHGVRVALTLTW